MSNHIEPNNSELFLELSEQEQETVSGGYDVFLQKTDIATFANHEANYSDGVNSTSSKSQTGYTLSQFTIGFNLDSLFGGTNSVRRSGLSRLTLLYRLLLSFF
jgi:hypothetical protein